MNLDYIEITKFLGKDTINTHYLKQEAIYSGVNRYSLEGCRKIEIWHYLNSNQVKIKGSLPYFINGHNYFSTLEDWKEAFDYIQGCLCVNLYSGLVEKFEFGTIQEIPFPEATFIRNHIKVKGMESKPYMKGNIPTGKEFVSPSLKIKVYDVSRNIKNKVDKATREELTRVWGWDKAKHYIKIENHYKKPEACFGSHIYLNEIISQEFQRILQLDLISKYSSIMKTGNVKIPIEKKNVNAGTIPLFVLKDLEKVYNFNTEELLNSKIKEIPDNILSPEDKKARRKIIRENWKKITSRGVSEYDISELLQAKIKPIPLPTKNSTPFLLEEKGEEILTS